MDLKIPGPFKAKSCVRGRKIDPPGARGESSILNVYLVVAAAAVEQLCTPLTCLAQAHGEKPLALFQATSCKKLDLSESLGGEGTWTGLPPPIWGGGGGGIH